MTEHRDDELTSALHGLRRAVQGQVPVPASAAVRAAAERQLRVRRTTVGVLAGVAVLAIAVGGATVLRPTAGPPVPPVESPAPSEAPVTPSPRPTPGPMPAPPDDPIADVDWSQATIDIPPQERCPGGEVGLTATPDGGSVTGPEGGFPQLLLETSKAVYGDLTGDGRAEAVVEATCIPNEEASLDGEGQLLVVSREPDGRLAGIAWVGPRGAIYQGHWIADEYLYVDAHPWHVDFEWARGVALRYRWDGTGFSAGEWAPEYPPILPAGEAEVGPPVRLGPVAGGLGCPDATIRFDQAEQAQVDGVVYDLHQPSPPSPGPHLVDLDHTGKRLLLIAIACTGGGQTTRGLAVFEPTGDSYQGISVLAVRPEMEIGWWNVELASVSPNGDPRLVLILNPTGDELTGEGTGYRWNGTVFEPTG